MNRRIIKTYKLILCLLCFCNCALSQDIDSIGLVPKLGLEYSGEFQMNNDGNCNVVNVLRLSCNLPFSRKVAFDVSTVSVMQTNEDRIGNDFQVFSNLDAYNLPLTLAVAGITLKMNTEHTLFAGVRNLGEDYFTSDVTSLFTNSSCGVFPTISLNYPLANYPCASLALHYAYLTDFFTLQASIYNGVASDSFSGRSSLFRFCPESDGVFGIVQGEYKCHCGNYFLGAAAYYGQCNDMSQRGISPLFWIYSEQKIAENCSLIVDYSHDFGSNSPCRDFAGVGGKINIKGCELGVFSDYVSFYGVAEWATELTCKAQISKCFSLQPAIHIVKTGEMTFGAGLLRIGVEL